MGSITALANILDRRIQIEAAQSGVKPEAAIARVARQFRASAGTIANILRCKNGKARVKSVCFSLGSRIIHAAIADIEREQERLEKDRTRLLALAVNADTSALAKAEEGLRLVREALAEMRGLK